jgi:hypothetical protein
MVNRSDVRPIAWHSSAPRACCERAGERNANASSALLVEWMLPDQVGEPGAASTAGDPTEGVGSWLWFLTPASVEQPPAVRSAMSAYQSDVAVTSGAQDGVCVVAVVVPTPNGADALGAAFEKWAAVDPAHRKTAQRSSGAVRVNSCCRAPRLLHGRQGSRSARRCPSHGARRGPRQLPALITM